MNERLALASLLAFAACAAAVTSPSPSGAQTTRPPPAANVSTQACAPPPSCPEVALEPGPPAGFRHKKSSVTAALGSPRHRARDLFQVTGEPQWLSAKLAYGKAHKDLEDEDVDIWVLRSCSGGWDKLGTARTTDDDSIAPDGRGKVGAGRVFFRVPSGRELSRGLHRVRFVVAGDRSATDAVVEILPPGATFFVSDIDGTLTSSEDAEIGNVLVGRNTAAQADAARALRKLSERGARPFYLSARPDWITDRTHKFLAFHGFPHGAVRVTTSPIGFKGEDAASFKSGELAKLAAQGLVPAFAFGNRPTDTVAFERAKIPVTGRFFLGLPDPHGGRRIESYAELMGEFSSLPCR